VVSIVALLRLPGILAVLTASVVTVTSLDLLTVYLPLLGTERQVDASAIGLLLAVRSVAAGVARIFYARLLLLFGRHWLSFVSISIAAAAFVALTIPWLPAMHFAVLAIGVGLGI